MASEPTPTQPTPPRPPSGLWKWTKRIGCTFMLAVLGVVLTCCGLTCGGAWWLENSVRNANADVLDQIHAEALRGGDVKAMHEHADPALRARIPQEELLTFVGARPGLLERGNFIGVQLMRRKIGNDEFVKIECGRGLIFGEKWEIVCKVVNDVFVFVGISPGLDEFVPDGFKFRPRTGRRHRWRD